VIISNRFLRMMAQGFTGFFSAGNLYLHELYKLALRFNRLQE
jgi:hypothetical protein